jgi:outer membrane protein assembly factor BamB
MYRRLSLILLLVAALGAGTAEAARRVVLNPAITPPTSSTTVTLTGFAPNAAVDIYFDTTDSCLALTNGSGKASCRIQAPPSAPPGVHYITAVQRANGLGARAKITLRTNWLNYRGFNNRQNSANPFENVLGAGNVHQMEALWRRKVATHFFSAPVVVNGVVYAIDAPGAPNLGKLYALNAATGAAVAGYPKTLPGVSQGAVPAVVGKQLFTASKSIANVHQIIAFDLTTGGVSPGFPRNLTGCGAAEYHIPPAAIAGKVFIACGNRLFGFNTATGAVLPGFPLTVGPVGSSLDYLLAVGNHVYAIGSAGTLFGFDASTGAALAGYPLVLSPTYHLTALSVANGKLFVTSIDGKLYGFVEGTTAALPGYPVTVDSFNVIGLSLAGGRVYVNDNSLHVRAYRMADGGLQWVTQVNFAPYKITAANGVLYTSNINDRVMVFDSADGSLLWSVKEQVTHYAGPVVVDGRMFLANNAGEIVAYGLGNYRSASVPGAPPAFSTLKPDHRLKPVATADGP